MVSNVVKASIVTAIATIIVTLITVNSIPIDCEKCTEECNCLKLIDKMETPFGWSNHTLDNNSSIHMERVPGKVNNAIKMSYNLSRNGWAGIEKDIDPAILSSTKGIKIYYKGTGQPESLEIKLKDKRGPVFVFMSNSSTAVDDWTPLEMPYNLFKFGWCDDKNIPCQKDLNLNNIDSLEFYVSNKPEAGDVPGQGFVIIDEVEGMFC